MSNSFKSKKKQAEKKPEPPSPRSIEVIQSEYFELLKSVGQKQYQAEILKGEIYQINQTLLALNLENSAAQELLAKAQQEGKNEVSVQSNS